MDVLDERQYTPLHVAVRCSEETNVLLLLENGADPNAKDNKKQETPLHKARSSKMVQILLSYGADPYLIKVGKNVMKTAYDVFLDKNASAVELLMNNGITCNNQDLSSTHLLVIFDLEPFKRQTCLSHGEMSLHNKIVTRQHKNLLKHPLPESFLQIKYRLIRPLFLFNVIIFSLFTLSITTLTTLDITYCRNFNITYSCFVQEEVDDITALYFFKAFYVLTGMATAILFLREFIQMLQGRLQYFKDYENLIEAVMFGCNIAYLTTLYTNYDISPNFGALAVLLAWMELTLLLGRFPAFGIYVFMSLHVTMMIIAFLLFYTTFLMGFTFAFHLLLPNKISFGNPFTSFMKGNADTTFFKAKN